ncbi:hypothetical protein HDU76_009064 [Blyttiomyces sp. JEL0837]|nr:hypothetical protein HDU76_009064 [Blyttiomyces sp. JEL0837]
MSQRPLDNDSNYDDSSHSDTDVESDFSVLPDSPSHQPNIQSTSSQSQSQSPNHQRLSRGEQRKRTKQLRSHLKSHSENPECLNCHTRDPGPSVRAWRISKRGELVCNGCYQFELKYHQLREPEKISDGVPLDGSLRKIQQGKKPGIKPRKRSLDATDEEADVQPKSTKKRRYTYTATKSDPVPAIKASLLADPPLKDKRFGDYSLGKPGIPFILSVINPKNAFKLNKPIDVQQMITHLPALLRQNVLVRFKLPLNIREMTTRDWVNKTNFLAESLRQFYCELFEVDEVLAREVRFTQDVFRVTLNISAILQKFPPSASATKEELIKHLWKQHDGAAWPGNIPVTNNNSTTVSQPTRERESSLEDGEIDEDGEINEDRNELAISISNQADNLSTSNNPSFQPSVNQRPQTDVQSQTSNSSVIKNDTITISKSKLALFKEIWDHSRIYHEILLTDSAVDFILDVHDKLENQQPVSLDVSRVEPLFTEIISLQKAAVAHVRRSRRAEAAWGDVVVGDGGNGNNEGNKNDTIIVSRTNFDAFKKLWDDSGVSQEDLLTRDVVDFVLEVLDCVKKGQSVPLDLEKIEALVEEAAVLQDVAGRHVRRSERVELAWKEGLGDALIET